MRFPGATHLLIFARTRPQAERFLEISCEILEGELKLVVNKDKTHITSVYEGVPYLGFIICPKVVSMHSKKAGEAQGTLPQAYSAQSWDEC